MYVSRVRSVAALSALWLCLVSCGEDAPSADSTKRDEDATAFVFDNEAAACVEGGYDGADDQQIQTICTDKGGVDYWLHDFAECGDGSVVDLALNPSCTEFGGFVAVGNGPATVIADPSSSMSLTTTSLAPSTPTIVTTTVATATNPSPTTPAPSTAPATDATEAGPDDVALCNDGSYSGNKDFSATCSSGDGVDQWLSKFVVCTDGRLIAVEDERACPGGKGGFMRRVDDSSSLASFADRFGLQLTNAMDCTEISGPSTPRGLIEYVCTRSAGMAQPGKAYVIYASTTPESATLKYLNHPEYDELDSTFVYDPDTKALVFAISNTEVWGIAGPDFNRFDAVDTDCLQPATDDPALCG